MKGAVLVLLNLVNPGFEHTSPGLGDMKKLVDFAGCLPIRYSAFHVCLKKVPGRKMDSVRNTVFRFCLNGLPKYMRERCRVHHGSPFELQYQLSTYGIPQDTFPVDASGNFRDGIRNAWFYKYMANNGGIAQHVVVKEDGDDSSAFADDEWTESLSADEHAERNRNEDDAMSSNSSEGHREQLNIVALPYSNQDVLLGRGHEIQNHPGNAAFRDFLSDYQDEYDGAPRLAKRNISKNLTRTLMATGIRFWQRTDGDRWIETSFDEAEKKVGQVFRSARKRNNSR